MRTINSIPPSYLHALYTNNKLEKKICTFQRNPSQPISEGDQDDSINFESEKSEISPQDPDIEHNEGLYPSKYQERAD